MSDNETAEKIANITKYEYDKLSDSTKKNIKGIKSLTFTEENFDNLKELSVQYVIMDAMWGKMYMSLYEDYKRLQDSYNDRLKEDNEFLNNMGNVLNIDINTEGQTDD